MAVRVRSEDDRVASALIESAAIEFPAELYPPYVSTPDEKRRWAICVEVAESISSLCEPTGVPDGRFVFLTSRSLYSSPVPTGDEEVAEALDELDERLEERALELAESIQEAPAGMSEDEMWAQVGRHMDVLDELLGNPDDYVLEAEGEVTLATADARAGLREATYREVLHPRDRLGKWAQKLAQLRAFVKQNRHVLRDRPGPALPEARAQRKPPSASLVQRVMRRYDVPEEKARTMVSRHYVRSLSKAAARSKEKAAAAAAKGHKVKVIAIGTTLTALANLYVKEHPKLAVTTGEAHKDAFAATETALRAEDGVLHSGDLARWVAEHREEVSSLLSLAHHIIRAAGVATGLAGAAIEDDGGGELEVVEALAA